MTMPQEEKKLSERLTEEASMPAWVLQEVAGLEQSLELNKSKLTKAHIAIDNLTDELEEAQLPIVNDDNDYRLKEVSTMLGRLLQQAQAREALNDVEREALHFLRTEGLISW